LKLELCDLVNEYTGLSKIDARDLLLHEEAKIHYESVYKGVAAPFERHYFLLAAGHIINDFRKKSGLYITLDKEV